MNIDHQQLRSGEGPKNRRGPRLGSGAPIGCVPVTRPRRDRVMGSSILASLSEAGGNDPRGLVSKPLPPHSLDPADRVERNPRPFSMQTNGPKRTALRELDYAGFTGVSRLGSGPSALAACRSGKGRPTAESASAGSRLRFRNPRNEIFSTVPQNTSLILGGTISAAGHLTRSRAICTHLLNRATSIAWRLRECGS